MASYKGDDLQDVCIIFRRSFGGKVTACIPRFNPLVTAIVTAGRSGFCPSISAPLQLPAAALHGTEDTVNRRKTCGSMGHSPVQDFVKKILSFA
jgi:hypothetical protein